MKNTIQKSINEKFYIKYAWIIFLIIGIVLVVGGLLHFFGFNTDPKLVESISGETIEGLQNSNPMIFDLYDFYFRGGGLSDVGFGFMILFIAIFGYRKKQKWSWYAFSFVPLYFLAWIFISTDLPDDAKSSLFTPLLVFILLSTLGLLLPFRSFFPKKTV